MRPHPRFLMAAVVVLAACNDSTAPLTDEYESLPAETVITGADHVITSSGVRRAQLRADTAYIFEDSAMTHLRVVNLEMYDDAGKLTSTLTSEAGRYNKRTQKTVATGNVVLIMPGPDGRTIWTEELHYDPATKRVWSEVPVRMLTSAGQDIHGEGFTADDQFVNINITGGAGTGLPLPLNR
ncbi:MAG: LPS export ABC transporter periplasmic protein LptC [Longimicrobiales bacterium]